MTAYYNEFDPIAAEWLRNLIKAGHIAPGDVDERSILDVKPDDLKRYTQCHFFAGIGVWSYALRRAGWPDDRPVWTGSCPCQPFSAAGRHAGFDDERHLWPAAFHLIEERRPLVVFGEQVASKDGYAWLDLVQADLEGTGYTVGAIVAPAAGFGAPHQRHRMYWVADADEEQRGRGTGRELQPYGTAAGRQQGHGIAKPYCEAGGMADSYANGQRTGGWAGLHIQGEARAFAEQCGELGTLGNPGGTGLEKQFGERRTPPKTDAGTAGKTIERAGASNGFWSAADWIYCRDEKYRPVEPGTFPLAHGAAARVGRLRAYGNAICAPQAEEFIKAYLACDSVAT
ncbi:DNA cytosine methyltransferase [Nitrosovibrio sp. Nv4]|uniref:DNA cytosine methyltransferase n=1 Tax=Nitrosovibrio sp. Nv4 TaxID=1945880 RepID=UPI000BDD89EF|nr:DNA cytosine methyltransferase [Nitrosovibrio sp. Nv4]SOD41368.1 DNA (cytosine-5)-methyltransferase 1 [Nitrosovibrio sp. Nv4]